MLAEETTLSIADLISTGGWDTLHDFYLDICNFEIFSNYLRWCVLQNCLCFLRHILLIVLMCRMKQRRSTNQGGWNPYLLDLTFPTSDINFTKIDLQ